MKMEGKFLITGSTGFIGACLTRFLVSANKRVCIIVRNKQLNWRLNDITSKLAIYECDLLSTSLQEVVNKIQPTFIFHLAAYGTLPKDDDVNRMVEINVKGTLNLINAVKKNKFKLFINTGSSSEYGIKNKPMRESDILLPINDYGVTKAAATLFCYKIASLEKLPIITLRLFSPYGYFEDKGRLIPQVVLSLLNKKIIKLSSPFYVRDFIFIEDVIKAYMKAIAAIHQPGEIFNIGSAKQHTIKEIVETILQITKSDMQIAWGKVKKQTRQKEPLIWQADITKAKRQLNWQAETDLSQGLTKTVDWFRVNKKLYAI